jgi:hypothetical protein
MKKDSLTRDFPSWKHLLGPMGPRSLASALAKVRDATLNQMEAHLGRFLPAPLLQQQAQGPNSRDRIFCLSRTFWCFLWQMLQANTACREVVRQVQALFKLKGGARVDEATGAYCQARQRLPLSLLEKALSASAQAAVQRAPSFLLLAGRALKFVDSSSLRLADSPKNQKKFPQPKNQKPGCGFPVLRLVVLFCGSSGVLLARRIGSLCKSELKLLRDLVKDLKKGDILLGDRGFGNFTVLAFLLGLQLGIDFIGRVATGSRRVDFRRGQRLGKNDRLFVWKKNPLLGQWLTTKIRDALPLEITVRIVRFAVPQKGFRPTTITVVTTLLDPELYPAGEIAAAYLRRWRLEMCFDDLKTTLGLESLKCLTPEMVEKELLAGLILHNLLRSVMVEAAQTHAVELDQISFKGSLDAFRQFSNALCQTRHRQKRRQLWTCLLQTLADDLVAPRPGRLEPRAVKHISKYPKLTRPRHKQKDRPSRSDRRGIAKKRHAN